MRLVFVLEFFCLWCSRLLATSPDKVETVETSVTQNCDVYFRNPETKAFIKMGSLEDLLYFLDSLFRHISNITVSRCLAPIGDFISSKYVTMFSNERLLGQSTSQNLVELSILAKNATVGNAIVALVSFEVHLQYLNFALERIFV